MTCIAPQRNFRVRWLMKSCSTSSGMSALTIPWKASPRGGSRYKKISYAIDEVEAALRELVANRLVIVRRTPDGGTHYHINPRAESAIRRRLRMKTKQSHKRAESPSRARKNN